MVWGGIMSGKKTALFHISWGYIGNSNVHCYTDQVLRPVSVPFRKMHLQNCHKSANLTFYPSVFWAKP